MSRLWFSTLGSAASFVVIALATSVYAQRPAWQLLGSKEVDGGVDHDKISCHGKETYRALQFA